ncbi:MAG: DMT family transporter [Candidatus Aenigmarchaeota archaeon]|nr:DMT family transporter [Candidatus Aenigmarchaeota archaeon]
MNKGYLYVLAAVILWTFVPIVVRLLLPFISAELMLFYRFFFAALALSAIIIFRKKRVKLDKGRIKIFLPLAIIYVATLYTYILGIANTKIAYVTFLQQISPVYTFVLAYLFLKEGVKKNVYYALAISVLGILVIFYLSGEAQGSFFGNAMAVVSGVFLAGYTVLSRYAGRKYSAEETSLWILVIGSILLSFMLLQTPSLSLENWLLVLALGTFSTALPLMFYTESLKFLKAQKASIMVLMMNVTIPVAAFLAFGELPKAGSVVGGLLILAAALIVLKS